MKYIKTYRLFEADQTTDTSKFTVITWYVNPPDPDLAPLNGIYVEVITNLNDQSRLNMIPIVVNGSPTKVMSDLFKELKSQFGTGPYTLDQINTPSISAGVEARISRTFASSNVGVTVKAVPLNTRRDLITPATLKLLPLMDCTSWITLRWFYQQMSYHKRSLAEAFSEFKTLVKTANTRKLTHGFFQDPHEILDPDLFPNLWNPPLDNFVRDLIPLMALVGDKDLDDHIKANPLDLDLLDGFPDVKAGVLQRTGLKDMSSLARTMRKGIL